MRTSQPSGRVARDRERALVERLAVVVELGEVDVVDAVPMPSQRGHMPPVTVNCGAPWPLAAAFSTTMAPAPLTEGTLNAKALGRAEVRLAQSAEDDPQHRVRVGRRTDRRAGVGPHALLVDDDGRRQPSSTSTSGRASDGMKPWTNALYVSLIMPLRLGGDRVEHERALARARDTGEHRQPALGDVDADVLQVVVSGALHTDAVVDIGRVVRGRRRIGPRGHARQVLRAMGVAADAVVGQRATRRGPRAGWEQYNGSRPRGARPVPAAGRGAAETALVGGPVASQAPVTRTRPIRGLAADEPAVGRRCAIDGAALVARQGSEQREVDRGCPRRDRASPRPHDLAVRHDRRLEHAVAARHDRVAVLGREARGAVAVAEQVLVEARQEQDARLGRDGCVKRPGRQVVRRPVDVDGRKPSLRRRRCRGAAPGS